MIENNIIAEITDLINALTTTHTIWEKEKDFINKRDLIMGRFFEIIYSLTAEQLTFLLENYKLPEFYSSNIKKRLMQLKKQKNPDSFEQGM